MASFGADRWISPPVWLSAVLFLAVFAWIAGGLLLQGWSQLSLPFFLSSPVNAGLGGGILPILVSTSLILAVCLTVAVPVGLGTAIFLAELTHRSPRLAWPLERSLDLLAGVPSIVFGLFGNAFFCKTLGLGFSILSGGLTLACMVLPLLVRISQEGLVSVPISYRLGGAAAGFSPVAVALKISLPVALPSILAGVVLSVGRALAETAALIFTSGYVTRMPSSLLDSGRALSVHIYDLSMNVPGGDQRAAASAFLLLFLVLVINGIAGRFRQRWAAIEEIRL